MKVWKIALSVLVIGITIWSLFLNIRGCNKTPIQADTAYINLVRQFDSLQRVKTAKQVIINHRDTVLKKQIIYVKTQANAAYNTNIDSATTVLILWARQLADSQIRYKYFTVGISSDTSN